MDKKKLVELLIAQLEADLLMTKEAAKATYEAATNEESKPENEYDTRALEASYLAGAQAKRAAEIDRALSVLRGLELRAFGPKDGIASGALVNLDLNGKKSAVFLLPQGGGTSVSFDGSTVKVVTPVSNLGEALLGLKTGDVAEVKVGRDMLEYEVLNVI